MKKKITNRLYYLGGTWNYRVMKKAHATGYSYGIYEVFYTKKGEPHSMTMNPIDPYGENLEELQKNWHMMGEALFKPVLDYDEIEKKADKKKKKVK